MVEKNVNLVVKEKQEASILLVHDERMKTKENMWCLENGASNHMCGDKDKFVELDESIKGNVTFANYSKVSIKEKGTILIQMKDDSH
jgi:hypothetical protein